MSYNTHIASIALPPSTARPQFWAELLTFNNVSCKKVLNIHRMHHMSCDRKYMFPGSLQPKDSQDDSCLQLLH